MVIKDIQMILSESVATIICWSRINVVLETPVFVTCFVLV